MKHLKEALRLDPDSREAASTFRQVKQVQRAAAAGRQHVRTRQFEQALAPYAEAIEAAALPTHAPLCAILYAGAWGACCLPPCEPAVRTPADHTGKLCLRFPCHACFRRAAAS